MTARAQQFFSSDSTLVSGPNSALSTTTEAIWTSRQREGMGIALSQPMISFENSDSYQSEAMTSLRKAALIAQLRQSMVRLAALQELQLLLQIKDGRSVA